MPRNASVFLLRILAQGGGRAKNSPETVFGTNEVVEERSFVISLANFADDGACFEIGGDGVVNLDQIIVIFERLDEGAEVHVGEILVGLGEVVAL